jgi:hypothetical protein
MMNISRIHQTIYQALHLKHRTNHEGCNQLSKGVRCQLETVRVRLVCETPKAPELGVGDRRAPASLLSEERTLHTPNTIDRACRPANNQFPEDEE